MIGVVLEGGGAKGAYHAGAIKALLDKGIIIDGVVGTSIGSINAAFVCAGEYKKMIKLWKSTTTNDLIGIDNELIDNIYHKKISKKVIFGTLKTTIDILKNAGVDTTKLKKILNENINEKKIRDSVVDFGLVTYNLSDRKPEEVFKEDIPKGKLIEYLIASCYLPVFKSEKIIDNKYYLDGGFYDNLPISMLLKKNYKKVYAIRTGALGRVKKPSLKEDQEVIYIKPKERLGTVLVFTPEKNERNMKLGYYDTLRAIDNLDGTKYYIKNKKPEYFDKILRKITPYMLDALMKEFKTKNKKTLTIKVLEKLSEEYYINRFKVYSLPSLILKLKFAVKINNKYYDFIKNIKLKF